MLSDLAQVNAERDILLAHDFDIAVPLHYDFIHTYCHLGIVDSKDEFRVKGKVSSIDNVEYCQVR